MSFAFSIYYNIITGDISSNIFRCCIDGAPASPPESLNTNEMTMNERIKYYYSSNTGLFMIIIGILTFIFITIIIGLICYIKKLQNGYTKANSDDIIQPQFIGSSQSTSNEPINTEDINFDV